MCNAKEKITYTTVYNKSCFIYNNIDVYRCKSLKTAYSKIIGYNQFRNFVMSTGFVFKHVSKKTLDCSQVIQVMKVILVILVIPEILKILDIPVILEVPKILKILAIQGVLKNNSKIACKISRITKLSCLFLHVS